VDAAEKIELRAGETSVVKELKTEGELHQTMLAAAREHEECRELKDLIFGPTLRPDANWDFGIAGKNNQVSVACYSRLEQIAKDIQANTNLFPSRRPDVKSKRGCGRSRMTTRRSRRRCRGPAGHPNAPTFIKLEGQRPNWTMEWATDDSVAKAAFERIVRTVQMQVELE
jgi:hypothetical protein